MFRQRILIKLRKITMSDDFIPFNAKFCPRCGWKLWAVGGGFVVFAACALIKALSGGAPIVLGSHNQVITAEGNAHVNIAPVPQPAPPVPQPAPPVLQPVPRASVVPSVRNALAEIDGARRSMRNIYLARSSLAANRGAGDSDGISIFERLLAKDEMDFRNRCAGLCSSARSFIPESGAERAEVEASIAREEVADLMWFRENASRLARADSVETTLELYLKTTIHGSGR